MALKCLLVASLLFFSCLAATSYAATFSSLRNTLIVSASAPQGQVIKAGEDNITVTWSLNTTFPTGTDSSYATVEVKLCYAPISQKDRGWRKTEDDLEKDRTCQHTIVTRPYSSSNNNFVGPVKKDVPTATYFVRVYVHDSAHAEVAYGENTDSNKATNLIDVEAISGRHASLDIASVCFSVLSVVSLFGFFFMEKRKAKLSQQK